MNKNKKLEVIYFSSGMTDTHESCAERKEGVLDWITMILQTLILFWMFRETFVQNSPKQANINYVTDFSQTSHLLLVSGAITSSFHSTDSKFRIL